MDLQRKLDERNRLLGDYKVRTFMSLEMISIRPFMNSLLLLLFKEFLSTVFSLLLFRKEIFCVPLIQSP